MTDKTIAIPLDMGKISKDFESTNQFEIFKITPNKVLRQSTITSPIAEKPDTITEWLSSFGVEQVFVFKNDKNISSISKNGISVIKVPEVDSAERLIWEYVKGTIN